METVEKNDMDEWRLVECKDRTQYGCGEGYFDTGRDYSRNLLARPNFYDPTRIRKKCHSIPLDHFTINSRARTARVGRQ